MPWQGDGGLRQGDHEGRLGARLIARLDERHALLERLSRIQRSISVGAPLQEVLDAITAGAAELLEEDVIGLRLLDLERSGGVYIASSVGLSEEEKATVRESDIGEGAGGRAILDDALVVVEDYRSALGTIEHFASEGLEAAMAAPVHDGEAVVGSLVVASYKSGRHYSAIEREMLMAFAEHASLALADARMIAERERLAGRHAEERYRLIVDTTSEGVWMLDADDRTFFVNDALIRMLGRPAEELAGQHPGQFMDEAAEQVTRAALQRRRAGVRESYEVTWRKPDGSPLHVLVSASPLTDDDGSYAGAVAMIKDVTALNEARAEQAELQERLQRAQTLEGIGTLAGQVAHDFNNILSVIQNLSQLALRSLGEEHPARLEIARIEEAAEHGGALTSQLLLFSRKDEGTPEVVVIGEIVRAAAALAAASTPPGVTLRAEIEDRPLEVRIEPTRLRQAVLNLVDNAFDAMPDGGEVVVAAGARSVLAAGDRPHLRPGLYASLVVRDSGHGMTPDVAARALAPMFTTKPPGEGTGFGLAIVAGIAEQAGGAVELRSTPGRGTEVELLLPRTDEDGSPADRSPAALIAEAAGRGESILLVEDDDGVRDLTRRILLAEGFQVFDAAGAAEALAIDAERNGEFHLVLTDNTMPGTSGIELLAQLSAIRAGAPAIVMSGFVAEPSAVRPSGPAITWLQKPFGASGLLAAVSAALRRAPA